MVCVDLGALSSASVVQALNDPEAARAEAARAAAAEAEAAARRERHKAQKAADRAARKEAERQARLEQKHLERRAHLERLAMGCFGEIPPTARWISHHTPLSQDPRIQPSTCAARDMT